MKVKIEIESHLRDAMNFAEWVDKVTENLCEWTEKYRFDKETNCWTIEIEGS